MVTINSIIESLLYTKKKRFIYFTHIKICFSATVRNGNIHNFTSMFIKVSIKWKRAERSRGGGGGCIYYKADMQKKKRKG